jgi:hypothetical protein
MILESHAGEVAGANDKATLSRVSVEVALEQAPPLIGLL